jgi:hypothetical protein
MNNEIIKYKGKNCFYHLDTESKIPVFKSRCGFMLTLFPSHNKDYNSKNYGELRLPDGDCIKCKRKIKVKKI